MKFIAALVCALATMLTSGVAIAGPNVQVLPFETKKWKANMVYSGMNMYRPGEPWEAQGVSVTLETAPGSTSKTLTFTGKICNYSGNTWRGEAGFYRYEDKVPPTPMTIGAGQCGAVSRELPKSEGRVHVTVERTK